MTQWDEQRRAEMRLTLVPGVGPRTRCQLLERFGSPAQVLSATYEQLLATPGVGGRLARRILDARQIDVDSELDVCREHGVQPLLPADDLYPQSLRRICDPPGVLFLRGALLAEDELSVAIVGTRHATRYGLTQAERLAASLTRAGLSVVSGLARGIDSAAHRGALAAGGRTLAVLASGVLNVYPPEHTELAEQVARQGAVLSEAPPRRQPMSGAFPQRNRLISGLALGVIVVEAAERSGALITARHAMEQGREVFAVPGRIDSRMSCGCHQLLRDGAKLVEHVDDVLEELSPLAAPLLSSDGVEVHHPAELKLSDLERTVLEGVDSEATLIDDVADRCGLPIQQVMATLCVLETRRLIRRLSGSQFARI